MTWSSEDMKRMINLGYTYSYYSDQQGVHQLTPTIGATLSDEDWIQLRAYLLKTSYAADGLDGDYNAALEVKLTHSFKKSNPQSKLNYLQLTTLLGRREYAVDPDTATVYDSEGVQTGGVTINSKWDVNSSNSIGLSTGYARYKTTNQSYSSNFISANWAYRPSAARGSRLLR